MLLNGTIECGGYVLPLKDAVEFSLADTTIAAVADLAAPYVVTEDDGETVVASFAGYVQTAVYLGTEEGSVRMRAARELPTESKEAIEAVEANLGVLSAQVTATDAKATTAQATATEAKATAQTAAEGANPQVATFARMQLPAMAATMTDEQALSVSTLWPEWSAASVEYKADDVARYAGHLYRCEQAHTSQESWTPDAAPSLWSQIDIAGDGVDVWTQPTGAHNAYNTGDRVHYPTASDPIYVSTIDGNTWAPDAYPQGWQLEE